MTILCDIGGTYIRIAGVKDGRPDDIRKYAVAAFADLQSALAQYCDDAGADQGRKLMIATAGYEDDHDGRKVWKFVNQNQWVIDPKAIENSGWQIEKILNDFEAAAWSLLHLHPDDAGDAGPSSTLCLIGPGTGLGLAYLHRGGAAPFVQKTHGGHMAAAAVSDAQREAIAAFAQDQTPVVFEHLVSGPGLQKLRTLYDEETALRLFHEFFGLFAANAVIAGHGYGGLYLTGGVVESLEKENKFDTDRFEKYFVLNAADSVHCDLRSTPVRIHPNPFPALQGLLHATCLSNH